MSYSNPTRILHFRSDETVDPDFIEFAVSIVSQITNKRYIYVSLATVLIYHFAITLDKEVKYFWNNPRNPISSIFFLNYFVGLLGVIFCINLYGTNNNLTSCRFFSWTVSFANLITIALIDYILLIRVLALFEQSKRLAIFLKTLLTLVTCTRLAALIYGNILQYVAVGSLGEGFTYCGGTNTVSSSLGTLSWTSLTAYGLILLGLALYKASEYWRSSSGFKGLHLLRVVIQDQVLYFGFVIFCSVLKTVNANLTHINPMVTHVFDAVGNPTLLCILGSQLLIDLKEAGERGENGGTNYTPGTVSTMQFV